jgi:FtsP/CotA-like multicopper oxidase with cupredoxin domain
MRRALLRIALALVSGCAACQTPDPADQTCPRFAEGSAVQDPPSLYSENGRLELTLNFRSSVDAHGLQRYCYANERGLQSPTLHVRPNDRLVIHLHNDLVPTPGSPQPRSPGDPCNGGPMSPDFTNLHFHGLSVPPTCHSDEVLKTLVGPGQTFDYELQIPSSQPPGLYWYHPHVHGYGEAQVQGGASGALVVDGIESANPALAGLPERTLILRDQLIPGSRPARSNAGVGLFDRAKRPTQKPTGPSWDISLNHIPITYPAYTPPAIEAKPREKQFWRVLNAAADTTFDLQLIVNGTPRPLELLAADGAPLSRALMQQNIPLSPGGRVEFIVVTPEKGDQVQLITRNWETGPDGEVNPTRPLANIAVTETVTKEKRLDGSRPTKIKSGLRSLLQATPAQRRRLYFSEKGSDESPSGAAFFLTVDGQGPDVFRMGQPPNIIAHQGTVEDWIIENRAFQDHVFHIHQMHFAVLEVNGKPVRDSALRDTIDIPFYDAKGTYPSVKLRMDFRDPKILGTFVFHCHILQHQDQGMMGTIQVAPPGRPSRISIAASTHTVTLYDVVSVTARLLNANATAAKGAVQFVVDNSQIFEAALASGEATFTGLMSQVGKHQIAATYLGDTSLSPSPSTSLSLNVVSTFFTLSPSPDIALRSPAQSAATPITINSVGGFDQPVKLSCSLPKEIKAASCSIAPSLVNGSGKATLTVATGTDAGSSQESHQGMSRIAPGNYAVTVLAVSGSGEAEIQKKLVVKLRVD